MAGLETLSDFTQQLNELPKKHKKHNLIRLNKHVFFEFFILSFQKNFFEAISMSKTYSYMIRKI